MREIDKLDQQGLKETGLFSVEETTLGGSKSSLISPIGMSLGI